MKQSPFERLIYDMAHDKRVANELMLGRRIGFYELRGEIGQGNFSTVRLGIHVLMKGQLTSMHPSSCTPLAFYLLIHMEKVRAEISLEVVPLRKWLKIMSSLSRE